MKLINSNDKINSFGGLNFISNEFDSLGLSKIITNHLGSRSNLATYQYSDIIKNLWMILFAGGDCAEDNQTNLKEELQSVINTKICSPDTLLRVQKSLSLSKDIYLSKNDIKNEFSENEKLNALNLSILTHTQQLKSTGDYTLDFDNQFIACNKYDSKKGYKMKKGYFPGIATIGKNIVYLQNRNGNSNVKFKQEETLSSVFKLLSEQAIKPKRCRMDCGSFTKEIIKVVEQNCQHFFIRAQRCGDLTNQIQSIKEWKKETIGIQDVEVASIQYKPFSENKEYRYVISREPNETNQIDLFHQTNFIYRAIITNNLEMSDKAVIEFYNQRGASEKIFDEMNNDFGWGNLPFSFLEENTVYMLLTAMCRNFYLYVLEKFSQKLDFIENTFRLKKFIFRFIVVPYKWVKKGGQKTLKLFTNKPYKLVLE
jgi:hypothetical protein